jgi:hypothetical protein
MTDVINVTSFEALQMLEARINRFSSRVSDALDEVEHVIQRKMESLDHIVLERKREVARWQRAYDEADPEDDDISYFSRRLDDAQEELDKAKRWRRRVEQAYATYAGKAKEARSLCTSNAARARAVLKEKIESLHEYANLKVESVTGIPVGSDSQAPGIGGAVFAVAEEMIGRGFDTLETSVELLTNFLLPTGFTWIGLDRIETGGLVEVPGDDEFRKLPKSDMIEGINLLRTRILPAIQNDPSGANEDYFSELDRQEGRIGANSLRNIYDAYFRGEAMRVEPIGDGAHYRIDHGRHRLKIATELGWPAIPAKIIR